jgi:hypothetical protein
MVGRVPTKDTHASRPDTLRTHLFSMCVLPRAEASASSSNHGIIMPAQRSRHGAVTKRKESRAERVATDRVLA